MTLSVSLPAPISASADNHYLPAQIVEQARSYARNAEALNTRLAHESGLRDFSRFCKAQGLVAFPASPQTVVLYVTALADRAKVSTIRQRLAAISVAHTRAGLESPTRHVIVRDVLRGIARTNGTAQTKKAALTLASLRQALLAIRRDDLKAKRDRAILLLGFAAALRRSEIAALNVADLHFGKRGLVVTIRRSKTDQTGEGHELAVPHVADPNVCAVTALRVWLEASGISEGPLFRSFSLRRQINNSRITGHDVANLIKSVTKKAHVEGDFSGHSLRAGFVTSAAEAGATLDNIARTTRHKSIAVLTGYIRRANLFEDAALSTIVH